MDTDKLEAGVRLILEGIGEDAGRKGLQKTPERVAEMLTEVLGATGRELHVNVGLDENLRGDHLIRIEDISFYSVCEHHLLPFFGKIDIAYRPADGRVAGFSSFSKIVDHFSAQLQLQERLTDQVGQFIMTHLKPHGVHVRSEATQLCASMRGEHKKDVRTVCEATIGDIDIRK